MTNQDGNDKPENETPNQEVRNSIENLIQMTEQQNANKKPSELNARLDDIESELKHLNAREAATNKAFRELLSESKRLGNEQSEQLAQTQQHITSLREDYRKLSQDAQRLAATANILSANLDQVRADTSAEITALKINTDESIEKLGDVQISLGNRATTLEERATQLSDDLDARVNVINTTISAVESRLQQQITEVAEESEQRDEALAIRSDMIEQEFQEETARLRNADDELANRALALEISSNRLSEETEDLQRQTHVLDGRSMMLEDRAESLESTSEQHADRFADVDHTIDRHYKGFALALVLIALTLGAITIVQQNHQRASNSNATALQQQVTSQAATQQASKEQLAALAIETDSKLAAATARIDSNMATLSAADTELRNSLEQQQASIAALQESLQTLEEQSDNTAARITALTPYRQFGKDNTIHTSRWLAQQDKQSYVIEIATVSSRQELYSIAYRWSGQLNQSNLSVIETSVNGETLYTLVYGVFTDQATANMLIRRLPVIDYRNRPQARQLSELL